MLDLMNESIESAQVGRRGYVQHGSVQRGSVQHAARNVTACDMAACNVAGHGRHRHVADSAQMPRVGFS
jgi:hypothetical protein